MMGQGQRLGTTAPLRTEAIHKPGEPPEGGCKLKLAPQSAPCCWVARPGHGRRGGLKPAAS